MVGLEPLHLALQHDAPARRGLPLRLRRRRAADRNANRRAALSRGSGAARSARFRGGAALQDAADLGSEARHMGSAASRYKNSLEQLSAADLLALTFGAAAIAASPARSRLREGTAA